MSADAASHIPENRIIAIIAAGGIGPAEQDHLDHCSGCRDMLASLADDLQRMRQRAKAATPEPRRRFVLPAGGAARPPRIRRWWGWAALGTGLSAVLLALVVWIGEEQRPPGLPSPVPAIVQWKDPEMIAINRLAENALPEAYLALSESLESGYDEGFIDFLIPPLEEDSVS